MIDADLLLDALTPPTLRIGGTEYTGRAVSFLERLEIDRRWNATDWNDGDAQAALVRFVCEKVDIPADVVLALPEAVMSDVMLYFWTAARGLNREKVVEVTPLSEPSESSA